MRYITFVLTAFLGFVAGLWAAEIVRSREQRVRRMAPAATAPLRNGSASAAVPPQRVTAASLPVLAAQHVVPARTPAQAISMSSGPGANARREPQIRARQRPGNRVVMVAILAVVCAMGLFTAGRLGGASASPTTYTLTPVADTYVNSAQPSHNFGANSKVRIDGSPIMRTYIRFDVPKLTAPVKQATLQIFNNSKLTRYDVVGITDNSWSETSVTYMSAPPMAWGIAGSAGPAAASSWTSVDVTALVATSGPVSLALMTDLTTQVSLAARESGSNAPKLVVETWAPATATATSTAPAPAPTFTRTATIATAAPTATATPSPIPAPVTPISSPGAPPTVTLPLRAAFYYPWFSPAWTQLGIYPYTKYHPTLGFYDERDQATVRQHIQAMEYANIGAGIASWWGQGSYTDARIPDLLAASAGTNFQWSIYYEEESQGDPTVSQLTADLTYLRDHYAGNPNFLHLNRRFVVFVYADGVDACGMADRWKLANAGVNAYLVLKVFPGYTGCASQPDGWHQYGPASAADSQGLYSYTISPGFDKVGEATRLARDLNRWQQDVRDMVASGARFQLVTTFNEWGEGTALESADEWSSGSGYGAYLDALHNNGGAPSTTSTPQASPTRTPAATNTPVPTATQVLAPTPTATPTHTVVGSTPAVTNTTVPTPTRTLTPTATAGAPTATPSSGAPCGWTTTAPTTYQHVIWIWMENHRYADVVNTTAAPYTTQLVHQCGAATNYAIVGSPSLPNYIGATSGSTFGIADDNPPSSHVLTGDNLFRQVRAGGMTEKSYQESMPSNCLLGNSGTYAVKHNPAAYYAGGSDRTACNADNVAMGTTASGSFLNDLNGNKLPNFAFITPNLCNDTHDCSVGTGDGWLQSWVPLILSSAAYRSGNTALIIMWDEYTPMPNVIISPSTPPGTLSNVAFSHYSLLRTTEEMLGITTYLGGASTAPSMRSPFGM